jgi:hypothetical protein
MRLECRSCHEPDTARKGFQPISMAKHCQECHTLQFEPAVTTREVPHGKPAVARVVIEEFYANLALQGVRDSFQRAFGVPGEGLLRRAGEPTQAERESALGLAQRKASKWPARCSRCASARPATWSRARRTTGAWPRCGPPSTGCRRRASPHKAHPHVKCATCHDVATSKKASDVSMPEIKGCRECHGGPRPAEGKVMSNCLLCHGFHDARHPWDPKFKARPANPAARRATGAK